MAMEKPEETPKNQLELTQPSRIGGAVIHGICMGTFGSRDGVKIIFPRSGDLIQKAMVQVAEKQLSEDKKFYENREKEAVAREVKDMIERVEKGFELLAKVAGPHMRLTRDWWQDFKDKQLKKVVPAL